MSDKNSNKKETKSPEKEQILKNKPDSYGTRHSEYGEHPRDTIIIELEKDK